MNLATMTQQIVEDTHSLVSPTTIWRKIIQAVRFSKDKRLWFSEKSFTLQLTANVADYSPGDGKGLPSDLVEIVGHHLYILIGGDPGQRYSIYREPSLELESDRNFDMGPGQPFRWDWYANHLRLFPRPQYSTDQVQGRYVSDIGVPRMQYDMANGNVWVFWTPDGARPLTGDFTNDWFALNGAADMIRARATYLLQSEVLKDQDAAQSAMQLWLELTSQLEDESEGKTGPMEIAFNIL